MSTKSKKQFGVWMDGQHATIVGRSATEGDAFVILGHVKKEEAANNSNENAANNQAIALTHKYFKDIAGFMQNVDELHVTGTGQAQEQFIHFLAETPQYKNAVTSESTSTKMGDEQLLTFVGKHFG